MNDTGGDRLPTDVAAEEGGRPHIEGRRAVVAGDELDRLGVGPDPELHRGAAHGRSARRSSPDLAAHPRAGHHQRHPVLVATAELDLGEQPLDGPPPHLDLARRVVPGVASHLGGHPVAAGLGVLGDRELGGDHARGAGLCLVIRERLPRRAEEREPHPPRRARRSGAHRADARPDPHSLAGLVAVAVGQEVHRLVGEGREGEREPAARLALAMNDELDHRRAQRLPRDGERDLELALPVGRAARALHDAAALAAAFAGGDLGVDDQARARAERGQALDLVGDAREREPMASLGAGRAGQRELVAGGRAAGGGLGVLRGGGEG